MFQGWVTCFSRHLGVGVEVTEVGRPEVVVVEIVEGAAATSEIVRQSLWEDIEGYLSDVEVENSCWLEGVLGW
jgi:hypothetical protein